MTYSMILRGLTTDETIQVNVKPYPVPDIRRNVTFAQDAAGYWHASDRGSAADFYDARVTVFGVKEEMEDFADWVETNARGPFEVNECDGVFWAPIVNHAVTFNAAIMDLDRLRRVFFSPTQTGVDEVSFTIRALAPTLVSTPSASLDSLRLQREFEQDKETTVGKDFYQDGVVVTNDYRFDNGRFVGSFRQSEGEARAILRYLMGTGITPTGRGLTFPFPTLAGVTYPFGKALGENPNCKVRDFSIARHSLHLWDIQIEFVGAP